MEETPKKCKDIIKAAQAVLERIDKTKFQQQFGEDIRNQLVSVKLYTAGLAFDFDIEPILAYMVGYLMTAVIQNEVNDQCR